MADAGFYRGTSSEQDNRFTDKERKLLKQMRFEGSLEEKICMDRVNLDVMKPWITAKLNDILGMEDDVLIEYVFSQLEEKTLNPKVMQINLTGFLNARRAREFMGELWTMLLEAQNSEDGIPSSLIEKKIKELQEKSKNSAANGSVSAQAAGSDWKDRYDSVTGGRYTKKESGGMSPGKETETRKDVKEADRSRGKEKDERRNEKENEKSRTERNEKDYERRKDSRNERNSGKSREEDRKESERLKERERGRESKGGHHRDDRTVKRSSRSPVRRGSSADRGDRDRRRVSPTPERSPPRRRFTERKDDIDRDRKDRSHRRHHHRKRHDSDSDDSDAERHRKKKKKRPRKHSDSDDSDHHRRRKKHKKEKKRKKERSSSDSD